MDTNTCLKQQEKDVVQKPARNTSSTAIVPARLPKLLSTPALSIEEIQRLVVENRRIAICHLLANNQRISTTVKQYHKGQLLICFTQSETAWRFG